MRNPAEIWRRRPWLWVPAVVFFLANAVFFSVYRLGYAGQVESLEETLAGRQKELQEIQRERQENEGKLQKARINEQRIQEFYNERLATRRQRLTDVTAEVNRLEARAGLAPRSTAYPEQLIEDFGLVKRSFNFSVEGTYSELRHFVNLLELSPSFLTLEEVQLTDGGDKPELRMTLKISTLFRQDPDSTVPVRPADTARAQRGGQ